MSRAKRKYEQFWIDSGTGKEFIKKFDNKIWSNMPVDMATYESEEMHFTPVSAAWDGNHYVKSVIDNIKLLKETKVGNLVFKYLPKYTINIVPVNKAFFYAKTVFHHDPDNPIKSRVTIHITPDIWSSDPHNPFGLATKGQAIENYPDCVLLHELIHILIMHKIGDISIRKTIQTSLFDNDSDYYCILITNLYRWERKINRSRVSHKNKKETTSKSSKKMIKNKYYRYGITKMKQDFKSAELKILYTRLRDLNIPWNPIRDYEKFYVA